MYNDHYFHYVLEPQDEKKRLEQILKSKFHYSQKLLQKLKIGEQVWLDGTFVYLNTYGKAGQTLTVNLENKEAPKIEPEDLPIDILYEDAYFLAVNKPAGQIVHPNAKYPAGALGNAVMHYWQQKNEWKPFRPTSRLDRNTSGIVLIAQNRFAQQQLGWLETEKKYWGLTEGAPEEPEGLWDKPLGLKPGFGIRRTVSPDGQRALTKYHLLKRFEGYSLLEFTLLTGRTHQIRAHCEAAGCPLLGDDFYGGSRDLISRQALHACSYRFSHPLSGETILIRAPLPEDMAALIRHYNETLPKI